MTLFVFLVTKKGSHSDYLCSHHIFLTRCQKRSKTDRILTVFVGSCLVSIVSRLARFPLKEQINTDTSPFVFFFFPFFFCFFCVGFWGCPSFSVQRRRTQASDVEQENAVHPKGGFQGFRFSFFFFWVMGFGGFMFFLGGFWFVFLGFLRGGGLGVFF